MTFTFLRCITFIVEIYKRVNIHAINWDHVVEVVHFPEKSESRRDQKTKTNKTTTTRDIREWWFFPLCHANLTFQWASKRSVNANLKVVMWYFSAWKGNLFMVPFLSSPFLHIYPCSHLSFAMAAAAPSSCRYHADSLKMNGSQCSPFSPPGWPGVWLSSVKASCNTLDAK